MNYTILGAGGPVGNVITRELAGGKDQLALFSRKEIKNQGNTKWVKGDLLDERSVMEASIGKDVIFLCAGLRYDAEVWAKEWPVIIQNAIRAANENQARLIFFDNVYMYGKVDGPMTEETPFNPCSKKGEVRAKIAETLLDNFKSGHIRGSIARAADFYGAESQNAILDQMVLANYSKNKKAMWVGNVNALHSFSYVKDAGKAMVLLAQHPESDRQTWHMPTAPALRMTEIIQLAAKTFSVKPSYMVINKFLLWLAGLTNPNIKGSVEMYYQYQYDYRFDSSKFEKYFQFKPASYEQGIKELSETLFKKP